MVSAGTSSKACAGPEAAFKLNSTGSLPFRSRSYRIAEHRIRVRLEEGFDAVLLIGEAGTGKSRLLAALAAELSGEHLVVHCAHPPFNAADALAQWRDIEAAAAGPESRHVFALIDDADHLPIELQLAAHGARGRDEPLRAQFVLAVKPAAYARFSGFAAHLDEALACCALGSLEDDEVADFVAHGLVGAGADPRHFTREALAHVALCAQGLPRLVNLICAKACLIAELSGERRVSAASVEEAAFVLQLGDVSIGRIPDDAGIARTAAA